MLFNIKIYDLERAKEDYKIRLKTAEETRKKIDEAFKVFIATKSSVQELCSDEVKQSIDDEVGMKMMTLMTLNVLGWSIKNESQ